jgi:hypothetical protein
LPLAWRATDLLTLWPSKALEQGQSGPSAQLVAAYQLMLGHLTQTGIYCMARGLHLGTSSLAASDIYGEFYACTVRDFMADHVARPIYNVWKKQLHAWQLRQLCAVAVSTLVVLLVLPTPAQYLLDLFLQHADELRCFGLRAAICMRGILVNLKRTWSAGDQTETGWKALAIALGNSTARTIAWLTHGLMANVYAPGTKVCKYVDLSDWIPADWRLPHGSNPDTLWTMLLSEQRVVTRLGGGVSLPPAADDAQRLEEWMCACDTSAQALLMLTWRWSMHAEDPMFFLDGGGCNSWAWLCTLVAGSATEPHNAPHI